MDGRLVVVALVIFGVVTTLTFMQSGNGKILPSDADVCAGRATPVPGVSAMCDPP